MKRIVILPGLAASLLFLGLVPSSRGGEIFSSDFSKGDFKSLGWDVKGDWKITNYGDGKPGLAKNPGPVAKFSPGGKDNGTLTKQFAAIPNVGGVALTFDAGFGWGAKTHVQSFQVLLLDAQGNGYIFDVHRANATWGAQWGTVAKFEPTGPLKWAPKAVDTTQTAVMDGGGLQTFTITRDASKQWSFNSTGWTGGPLTFTDATTTSFSIVQLRGNANTDDEVFGKVKLEEVQ